MGSVVDFAENVERFSYTQYCATGANQYAVIMILHLGTLVYILNKLTNEYSWVDRIWSLLPIGFAAHILYYQVHCQFQSISTRQWIMFGLICVWGLRLTFNYWRKGGYKPGSGEDYRWLYIRKNYPKMLVELLTFFFTSYYQIVLIYWFTAPIKYSEHPELNLLDCFLVGLWLLLFAGQIIADEQMWAFQRTKYDLLGKNNNNLSALPEEYKKGFITDGLYKYSRHPNFFCEISMWWVIFAFSVSSGGALNLSGIGAFLLTLLFQGSTALTEKISCEKYPQYFEYKKQVSMLIPMLPAKKPKSA